MCVQESEDIASDHLGCLNVIVTSTCYAEAWTYTYFKGDPADTF